MVIGIVPGGGLGATFLSNAGVIPRGPPDALAGRALGEIIAGFVQTTTGVGGMAASIAASATGPGAVVGTSGFLWSAALATGGIANITAGALDFSHALSMKGGSGPTEMHHTITRSSQWRTE